MPVLEWLNDRPEDLLLPNVAASTDASRGVKDSLDALAKKYTALGGMHVDGLKAEQVWIEARMVMEGVAEELGAELSARGAGTDSSHLESGSDLSSDLSSDANEFSDSDENAAELAIDQQPSASDARTSSAEEDDADLRHPDNSADDVAEDPEVSESDSGDESTAQEPGPDFDLAEFQQHVLQLEQDPDDDSEDIDYGADLAAGSDDDDDLHYEDFFAPPPKKSRQEKPRQDKPHKKRVQFADDDTNDTNDGDSASVQQLDDLPLDDVMASTRKDLFDSGDDEDESEGRGSERLSKFEQQQRELARQIEELENENVGEKEWGMRGEIKAAERPQDSLIDADIDFERGSKPAPIITEESTSTLEQIIKERIRKQQFDDLPRRSELAEQRARPELPEVQETKSEKSLAELYEDEQMRKQNPDYYSKQDSAAMEAAHTEIADLFASLSRRLDALCSWHFTPKAAAPSLSVVTDQPSISMEEAQPGTMAPQSQLAPQEVYRSEAATPMAGSEMSTSLKRHKRRERARSRAQETAAKASSKDKNSMFSALQKGNVTLVDRRGQKRDMRGNTVKEKAALKAANVKL